MFTRLKYLGFALRSLKNRPVFTQRFGRKKARRLFNLRAF